MTIIKLSYGENPRTDVTFSVNANVKVIAHLTDFLEDRDGDMKLSVKMDESGYSTGFTANIMTTKEKIDMLLAALSDLAIGSAPASSVHAKAEESHSVEDEDEYDDENDDENDECDGDCEDCEYADECDDRNLEGYAYYERREPNETYAKHQDDIISEKTDVVAAFGYEVVAKVVAFTFRGRTVYAIEVNKPLRICIGSEYCLDIKENGERYVCPMGSATLIVPYPIFDDMFTEPILLEDYRATGEVVSCKPGEDTRQGITTLLEFIRRRI